MWLICRVDYDVTSRAIFIRAANKLSVKKGFELIKRSEFKNEKEKNGWMQTAELVPQNQFS